jgi:hypothetical protein
VHACLGIANLLQVCSNFTCSLLSNTTRLTACNGCLCSGCAFTLSFLPSVLPCVLHAPRSCASAEIMQLFAIFPRLWMILSVFEETSQLE